MAPCQHRRPGIAAPWAMRPWKPSRNAERLWEIPYIGECFSVAQEAWRQSDSRSASKRYAGSSMPRVSMKATTPSSPVSVRRLVITKGFIWPALLVRMRRVSASITARLAPT